MVYTQRLKQASHSTGKTGKIMVKSNCIPEKTQGIETLICRKNYCLTLMKCRLKSGNFIMSIWKFTGKLNYTGKIHGKYGEFCFPR